MIKDQLENIPLKTGIYKFFDSKDNILYIGKALNLRSRVSSYFRDTHYDRPHIIKMIPLIDRFETIITENEVESLILETALIKKYKPKFNVLAKDDKSFSWIYISTQDRFPKVKIVRSIKKGDYKKGKLFGPYPQGKSVKRVFDYVRKLFPFCTCNKPKEPCLYYHLNLCPAPHHGKITEEAYRENINNIVKFLNGGKRGIISSLKKEMSLYAKTNDFEKAAVLRDKIADLEYLSQKISISPFESEQEYLDSRYEKIRNSLMLLSTELSIKNINRIECFDVSNINGEFAYAAMSVAINGRLVSDEYRVFKIKGLSTSDDPAMLREAITRRLKNSTSFNKPDLILVDGGISQLSVIKDLIGDDIKLLGISKGKRLKRKKEKPVDEFWFFKDKCFKNLKIKFPFLLLELRDEAHRFGIKYHRKNRAKYMKASILDKIDGVGVKRRKLLLKTFGTIENIQKASEEDLQKVLKNKNISKKVYTFFKAL